MARSVNLIDEPSSTFFRGKGNWTVENGVVYLERNDVISPNYATLAVTPVDENLPVTFRYQNIYIDQAYAFDSVQFHCRVKCLIGSAVDITLTNTNSDVVERSERTGFNRWDICRSQTFDVPDIGQNLFIDIQVDVRQHAGNVVKFTAPFMCISGNIFRDLFVLESFMNFPTVIREAEIGHEADHGLPDFPLSRMMELPGGYAGDVVDLFYDFQYLTPGEGGADASDPTLSTRDKETLSQFVEPVVAKRKILPWLSQFVGVYLDNPTTGKTPWENIPPVWKPIETEIDPLENLVYTPTGLSRTSNVVTATIGTHSVVAGNWVTVEGATSIGTSFNGTFEVTSVDISTISWSQTGNDESASYEGTVTVLDTEWIELENYNPTISGLDEYLRWQVKYAYTGMNAGTYSAIVNTVKRVLIGNKTVTVIYAWEGNPWQVLIRTKTSESPDGVSEDLPASDGTASFTITEYLKKVKPVGYKLIHECTADGINA